MSTFEMEAINMKRIFCGYGLMVIAAIILGMCLGVAEERPAFAGDDGTTTITGKITSIAYGPWRPFFGRRATIFIEDAKGKTRTVYVGHKTAYIPHRTPVAGDKVSIACIDNKGLWAGVTVTYK